jgi:hypothetical protein
MQKSFIPTAQQNGVLRTFCASPSSQSKAQACGSKVNSVFGQIRDCI